METGNLRELALCVWARRSPFMVTDEQTAAIAANLQEPLPVFRQSLQCVLLRVGGTCTALRPIALQRMAVHLRPVAIPS